jgi:hypothetical protein
MAPFALLMGIPDELRLMIYHETLTSNGTDLHIPCCRHHAELFNCEDVPTPYAIAVLYLATNFYFCLDLYCGRSDCRATGPQLVGFMGTESPAIPTNMSASLSWLHGLRMSGSPPCISSFPRRKWRAIHLATWENFKAMVVPDDEPTPPSMPPPAKPSRKRDAELDLLMKYIEVVPADLRDDDDFRTFVGSPPFRIDCRPLEWWSRSRAIPASITWLWRTYPSQRSHPKKRLRPSFGTQPRPARISR